MSRAPSLAGRLRRIAARAAYHGAPDALDEVGEPTTPTAEGLAAELARQAPEWWSKVLMMSDAEIDALLTPAKE